MTEIIRWLDFKRLLKALSDKEAVAQSEVDSFMENCAKRWQTREGTYQIKRRRLKPSCMVEAMPKLEIAQFKEYSEPFACLPVCLVALRSSIMDSCMLHAHLRDFWSKFLNLFDFIFRLNKEVRRFCFKLRPISRHDVLTIGRSAWNFFTPAVKSKKKILSVRTAFFFPALSD